ncbi:uncharacterized protein LOC110688381 [Chenopodium quinoa]|uniref:Transmembrane protein n=1 Tax=Chenopodium quinoa TaxID=63459 RepID=A0A803KRU2_CHEQI|nr:uncharacterized protein LOC110688381 [Chenopodium quinoa]
MATSTASSLFPFSAPIHHQQHQINQKNNIVSTSIFNNKSQPLISSLTLSKHKHLHYSTQKPRNLSALSAVSSEDAAVIPSETTQEIVSATTSGDDGVSIIISILLFIAFVALSILTIGVIYIAVTEFLTKREREKFEKEEEAKKSKKVGKKGKVKARAGPRGFGQKKIDDDFEDD